MSLESISLLSLPRHRQQWWSRCCWMEALSRPGVSDSLSFLLESFWALWEPSSHTAPFLIICRWQTSGQLKEAAGGLQWQSTSPFLTGWTLDPLSGPGLYTVHYKVNMRITVCLYLYWHCKSAAVDLIWQEKVPRLLLTQQTWFKVTGWLRSCIWYCVSALTSAFFFFFSVPTI